MSVDAAVVSEIVRRVLREQGGAAAPQAVPVGVSNRHIHLTQEHVEILFVKGYALTPLKDLSQPGQYACKELLTIIGPSLRPIENVRVLGPVRKKTQVEISRTDSFTLKVKPPVRESGDTAGSAGLTIVGPKGVVTIEEGCIIAKRHIHMSPAEAKQAGVRDGEYVSVKAENERGTVLDQVKIRVDESFTLEMHIDTDEANACALATGDVVRMRQNA